MLNIRHLSVSPLNIRHLRVRRLNISTLMISYLNIRHLRVRKGPGGRYADVLALVYPLRFAKEPL